MMEASPEQQPASVPQGAKQAGEVRSRWEWTEPSVWTDRMLETLERGVKGGKWYSLVDKVWDMGNLRAAFAAVERNDGAPGVDNKSVQAFGRDLDRQLERLQKELQEGRYRPRPARRVWIDKPGSKKKRPLGIPTVRDRVVEAALKHVIEPIFEKGFSANSHGFRPGRSCKSALHEVDGLLGEGNHIVVEVDIQGFFDHIDHDKLLSLVSDRISDGRILGLVGLMLKRGVLDEGVPEPTLKGTPQGGVVSPLLANIYLDGLDHRMEESGYRMVRYADDFVVLCEDHGEAGRCMEVLAEWAEGMHLTLHPEKTDMVDMSVPGAGFGFLGYWFQRSRRNGNLFRVPSEKSKHKLRARLRPYLKRTSGISLEATVNQINPILRGWFNYFDESLPSSLNGVSAWVRMRLRSILRKRHKKKGRGRGNDHQRWPNAYFAELGLHTMP